MLVAVCCGVAASATVHVLRPDPPPTRDVVVAVRPVDAGAELRRSDVEARPVPTAMVPADALSDPDDVVGHVPAVPLAAGLPLSAALVSGGAVAALAPPGTVVVPVRLDDATARLLRPGDRVDLVATAAGASPYLARRALVLPVAGRVPQSGSSTGGLLGGAGAQESAPPVTLVAVDPDEAAALSAASGAGALAAVLVR